MMISERKYPSTHNGGRRGNLGRLLLPFLALSFSLVSGSAPANAQQSIPPVIAARNYAQSFLDRMVQIRVQLAPNAPMIGGFGFIVGEHPLTNGAPGLLIVTADHLVRGSAAAPPDFHPITVVRFHADLTRVAVAEVLTPHLAPAQGDLAVLAVPKPPLPPIKPAVMGSQALAAGDPAWELGTLAGWTPAAASARFALRERSGWLQFEGLDNAPESAGGAVVAEFGLAGMVVGRGNEPTPPLRVVPVELMAAKFAEWHLPWDIVPFGTNPPVPAVPAPRAPAAIASPAPQAAAGQAPPAPRLPPASLVSPTSILPLLPAELASRGNWVPEGARASPWLGSGAPLLGSPTRGATRVGSLPPGRLLPQDLWAGGAYEIHARLDNGSWFLLASEGKLLGYVAGTDVVEVWPPEKAGTNLEGSVVREISAPGGKAILRDDKTHYTLTIPLTCALAYCNSVLIFTPIPPNPGSITPTFQVPQISGNWHQNDAFEITVPLPRSLVETKGTRLITCVGLEHACPQEPIIVGF